VRRDVSRIGIRPSGGKCSHDREQGGKEKTQPKTSGAANFRPMVKQKLDGMSKFHPVTSSPTKRINSSALLFWTTPGRKR
jgi:hypothetical protein